MRPWILQEVHTWRALQQNQELFVDPSLSEDLRDWPIAYNWMRRQMAQRVACYQEEHFPWWAWKHPQPCFKKPELYSPCQSDVEMVRLELVLPKASVLLSSFGTWEMVLGEGYVNRTNAEGLAWETALLEAGIDETIKPLPDPWQTRLTESWERIFDIKVLRDGGSWSTSDVQATFEKLRMVDVVDATSCVWSYSSGLHRLFQ